MQLPRNWAIGRSEFIFFHRWVWHPHPCVHMLVKKLRVQTDNVFSPSAQCTEAANKARGLIFMIRRSFRVLPKLAFIPLYGALVHLLFEYGMPACSPNLLAGVNHLERSQRLATRKVTGIRHLPLRRESAATGSSFLEATTTSDWPDYCIQDLRGLIGCRSEPGKSHHRKRGS